MTRKMKAAVLYGREDVRVEEIAVGEPGPGEVLLRVEAALTCGTDAKVFRRGYHAKMIAPPSVFGHEASGVIEAIGEGVVDFAPGDPVVVANSAPCGRCEYCQEGRSNLCEDLLFWNGSYAELALIPERIVRVNLLHRPASVQAHEGALVEPLACAVHGLGECKVRKGDFAAIIGAGPLGLMLLVLAKLQGLNVVVVGRSLAGLERARSLGAHEVVSTLEPDAINRLRAISPGKGGFPLVIEAVGRVEATEVALAAVRRGGQVNLFGGCAAGTVVPLDVEKCHYHELRLFGTFHHTPDAIRRALALISEGEVKPDAFIEGEEKLERLPQVLKEMTDRTRRMKTVIHP